MTEVRQPEVPKPALEDLLVPEARANPYPVYHRLREYAPVLDTGEDLWIVTSYEHVYAVLRDPRISSNFHTMTNYEQNMELTGRNTPIQGLLEQLMSFNDPPDHTRLRWPVQRAFTPRMIEDLRGRVEEIANELLDAVEKEGEIELMAEFAWQLPLIVVAEMLGAPPSERERFHAWSRDTSPTFDVFIPPEASERAERASKEFIAYFTDLAEERAREPKGDLLTALVQAEESDDLTPYELVSNLMLLMAAGHETTMNLIGNGTLALLRNPDQLELMRSEPGVLESAIEELLRYDSPIQLTFRYPKEDVELGGETIPAGTRMMNLLGAGNRDPARFPEPDRLDLTRGDRAHLAFGGGTHFCLGAALARVEGAVAFRALLERYPRLELATDEPEYRDHMTLRGLKALPLTT